MKRIITTFLIAIIASPLFAQDDVITKYFSDYLENDEFTKVTVTSKMFSLFTEIETGEEDDDEFLEAISRLKGLRVVSADSISNAPAMYKAALKKIANKGYEELMSVKDGDENFEFRIREEGDTISELMMLAGGDYQFHILTLYGEIDLRTISKLASRMKIDALDHLKKLDHNDSENKE